MGGMFPWPERQWVIFGTLGLLWVGIALHASLSLRRYGRRWWVWFILSVFFTLLPAAVVSCVEYSRALRRQRQEDAARAGYLRCPHCRAVLNRQDLPRAGGNALCPHCNMVIADEHYA
jgi:hypothetical protein